MSDWLHEQFLLFIIGCVDIIVAIIQSFFLGVIVVLFAMIFIGMIIRIRKCP